MLDRSEREQNAAEHSINPESQVQDIVVENDGEVTAAAAVTFEGRADDLDDAGDDDTSWWRSQRRFFRLFFCTRGVAAILMITALQAIATGCILPVVPRIMLERYQEQQLQNYDDPDDTTRPEQEAQSAAAWSNAFYSLLSVLGNPVLGGVSDTKGRRLVICGGLGLQVLPAVALWLVSTTSLVHPAWYYSAHSCTGVMSLLSLTFAALSDSFAPNHDRTAAFGLVLAVYFGGVHLAPALTLFLSESQVVTCSAGLTLLTFLVAIACLPETLESNAAVGATRTSALDSEEEPLGRDLLWRRLLWQWLPFREITILRRSKTLILLAITSFLSAMVLASDTTLLIYYIENELHLSIHDFVGFMFALAIWGALVQGVLLQPMSQRLGEHNLLRFTFLCGGLQNALYGMAHNKVTVFAGLLVSQFTKLNVPLFSLLAAEQAAVWEQGRMQGALFAVDALAKSIGPLWMELVYHCTAHNGSHLGPGFMFLCAAGVFVVGSIILTWLSRGTEQRRQLGRQGDERGGINGEVDQLEEALLGESSGTNLSETGND